MIIPGFPPTGRPDAETAEGEEVELPHLVITDALTIYALREYSIWEQFGLLGASIPGPQKRGTGGTLSGG
jgi:hypothetical protein